MVAKPYWFAALAALCASAATAAPHRARHAQSGHVSRFDAAIERLAHAHGVPERLIRRIIMRESRYAPHLVSRGNYGLMQIKLQTARGMGYDGSAAGLLDGETNLKYAVPYLANAYICAGRDEDRAVQLYAGGYYYIAKRKGLLGALRTAKSSPMTPEPVVAYAAQPAPQPQPANPFAFLFGGASAQPAAPAAAALEPAAASTDPGAAAPPPGASEYMAEAQAEPVVLVAAPLPPRRPRGL